MENNKTKSTLKALGTVLVGGLAGLLLARSRPAGAKVPGAAASNGAATVRYTVAAGDSLTQIAQNAYGVGREWAAFWIFDLNRAAIGPDINLIRIGLALDLPTPAVVNALPAERVAGYKQRYEDLKASWRS